MPNSIIIAIIGHAIFIFMRFMVVMENFDLVSVLSIPIIIVAVTVHILGIIGLLLRWQWMRKYTLFLFGFYLLMQVFQMDKVLKEFDPFSITWSVIAVTLSLYIFHKFYTEPAVQAYLSN